jgi:hypothetical protein
LALDGAGNLFIAHCNLVRKVVLGSGIISTVAGIAGDSCGFGGFSGDGGAATSANLSWVEGIALDSAGNLFIADFNNNRVRKVSAGTGIITTIAGTGADSSSGDGGVAVSAAVGTPLGVAVDSAGNLFITQANVQRVRKVAIDGTITSFMGNGVSGSSGDGGPPSPLKGAAVFMSRNAPGFAASRLRPVQSRRSEAAPQTLGASVETAVRPSTLW